MKKEEKDYLGEINAGIDELNKLTVKVLLSEYATPLGIVGRHDMKKEELINAIVLTNQINLIHQENNDEPGEEEQVEKPVKAEKTEKQKKKVSKKAKPEVSDEVRMQNKLRYIEGAEVGTIIAFKLPGMKAKSAKIIRRSTKNRKFMVRTAYDMEFVVSFDDVIWVKTNQRWPRGVYNMLKGVESVEADK